MSSRQRSGNGSSTVGFSMARSTRPIILTGAGSDGAVGVKAVKEGGSLILVQDPNEAEYPSMPRSAIASGVADFILPVRYIAASLPELVRKKLQLQAEDLGE